MIRELKNLWSLLLRQKTKEEETEEIQTSRQIVTRVDTTSSLLKPSPAKPPRRPVLYFAGNGIDERKMDYYVRYWEGRTRHGFANQKSPPTEEIDIGSQQFLVRPMDGHLLIRSKNHPPAQDTLFLSNTPLEHFAEVYSHRTPGRCIMYVAACMNQGHCIYLFFERDGTGFALLPELRHNSGPIRLVLRHERVDFRWDDIDETSTEFFTAPVSQVRRLCETIFEERVNPHLHLPYLYREKLKDIPLSWQSGSEKELRELAQAICLTEPGLFEGVDSVTLVFRSTTPYKRGGFRYVERDYERYTSRRLMSLCDLAFRLNPFTAMEWIERPGVRSNIQKAAKHVAVIVHPPSSHEKVEAFLTLTDWLEDTLHDLEKRALFGLPPHSARDDGR